MNQDTLSELAVDALMLTLKISMPFLLAGLVIGLLISIFDGVFLAQVLPSLLPNSDVQNLRWVFFGFCLVAFMILRPQGLFGAVTRRRGEAPPLVVEEGGAA